MGTRSVCGVRIDKTDKLSYNQFDGYPDGLGVDLIKELHNFIRSKPDLDDAIGELTQKARTLRLVEEDSEPSLQDQARFLKDGTADLSVSNQSPSDWYCLLRNHQGSILRRLDAGVALDSNDFINDSLFCEYAYVLDLDEGLFEIYAGFQTEPPIGHYKNIPPKKGYYACSLKLQIPIEEIQHNLTGVLNRIGEL